ncbi:hypothetical protein PoB_005537200 [Plakobranchus ocellatus]|uniref:Uncharacterized protein n=1 Tax=Plakobranchus ocellatus TaxID=259542 RepID=A0AAV4CBZ9_9GAST|nr:hypothetical protein PoB_005537200 [Plakobranchus ocellatus]
MANPDHVTSKNHNRRRKPSLSTELRRLETAASVFFLQSLDLFLGAVRRRRRRRRRDDDDDDDDEEEEEEEIPDELLPDLPLNLWGAGGGANPRQEGLWRLKGGFAIYWTINAP